MLAVSTLEHVGLDEDTMDPRKASRAITRLQSLVAPGGLLWVTRRVGYDIDLDNQIRSGAVASTRLRALRREESRNHWREVPVEQVWSAAYDRLLYTAHSVLVGEFVAPG